MRKLLLLFVCFCASIGAWAQPSITGGDYPFANVLYVTTTEAGTITSDVVAAIVTQSGQNGGRSILTVKGPINQNDIDALTAGITTGPIQVIDYGGTNVTGLTVTVPSQCVGLRLPITEDLTAGYGSNLQFVMSSGMNGIRHHAGDDPKGSTEINLHVTNAAGVSSFKSIYGGNPSWIAFRSIDLSTTVDNLDYSALTSGTNVTAVNYPADNTGEEYIVPATECTQCNITYNSTTKVADVHIVHPGHLDHFCRQIENQLADGARFVFDNQCKIKKEDLLYLLKGFKVNGNDATFYVDLYNITNGENTPMAVGDPTSSEDDNSTTNIDKVIQEAIAEMVSKNHQARGIILPLNTSLGTSRVEKATNSGNPTFTEYAAYYKESSDAITIHAYDMAQFYSDGAAVTGAQTNFDTAADHFATHRTAADILMVSSNNINEINVSNKFTNIGTKIDIIGDEMVKQPTHIANISVTTNGVGKFALAVEHTNIELTPCEKLILHGPINNDDIDAIGEFRDGPVVVDMKGATGFHASDFSGVTNSKVEYIVMPAGQTKEDLEPTHYTGFANLKAAISSSTASTVLTAYVKVAGSLAQARNYATGKGDGSVNPATVGLTTVILTGNLNASDINNGGCKVDANGHWTSGTNASLIGLNGEAATVTSFDLSDAVFSRQSDMNFYQNNEGFSKLTSMLLPTSEAMDTIPENCFYNIKTLKYLCVPYNYKYIRNGAFNANGGGIDHMTTTDASGVEIDNGPKTWTISANVKELGNKPANDKEFVETVFPMNVGVQEIYCLAVKVPKCYANVFPANACYGWGGDDPNKPYCRDKYFNGGNLDEAWAVLRFPSEESWKLAAGDKEDDYATLKRLYTDVNKVFTKKEQTGAVDANGDPIAWPTHWEGYRAYNQASMGLTWNDWNVYHNPTTEGHINDGGDPNQQVSSGSRYTLSDASSVSTGSGVGDYPFEDYMGWHQIVLAQATYVEPDEKIVDEKIVRDYELAGLYTFCIPFNMTYEQVVEWLGVPKSTDKVINRLNGVQQDDNIMPEIHQLLSVEREKGTGGKNNVVTFRLTKNLFNYNNEANSILTYYLDINNSGTKPQIRPLPAQVINAGEDDDAASNPITLLAGRPYVIKAYKRVNVVNGVDEFKITGQNIAKMIMTRYADQFELKHSAVENGLYEQLGDGDLTTLRFAIPYEGHKIQAMRAGGNSAYLEYTEDGKVHKYYYTMVGQYWEQPLPLYSIYMAKGKWYRYTDKTKGYKWDPYKCIIMATKEQVKASDDQHYGEGYRDAELVKIPNITGTDKLDGEFKLGYLDGRDDDDFDATGTSANYVFAFDDGIVELGEDGYEKTDIKQLDGVDLTTQPDNCKVYNMSGQQVGSSLNGLGKGMYIVNGKKIVVK